jgi:hypothetical protein
MAKKDQQVRLYYLGGLTQKKMRGFVSGGGNSIALPPVGGFIDVDFHIARDLMMKHQYILPDQSTVSAFTEDARLARLAAAGKNPYSPDVEPQITVKDFDDAALLAELEARGLMKTAETEEVEEPEPHKKASSKKSKEPEDSLESPKLE